MAGRKTSTEEDDDYWTSSTASRIKSKGFNFFDESQDAESTLATVKELMKVSALNDDADDDDDVINWDGTPSQPKSGKVEISSTSSGVKSARYQPAPATPASTLPPAGSKQNHQYNSRESLTHSTSSGAISSHRRNASTDSSKGFKSNTLPVKNYSPHASIDDIVSSSIPPKSVTLTDISKLEAENRFLKRSLQSAKTDKFAKIPPGDTVKRMIAGQSYSLELYKSKEDKFALLDTAIKFHDGNAITAAVMFLKRTVKQGIFNTALLKRPAAVSHYLLYLHQHYEFNEYTDILGMMGKTEEAAMFKYKQSASIRQPETKIKSLNSCLSAHFQSEPALSAETLCIQEQVALLERQLRIETTDAQDQAAGMQKFRDVPRIMYVLGTPLIDTLFYCCYHHYDLQENNISSPWKLKRIHKVSDKQFLWTALASRAKLKRWKDVEALFQSKGWFGSTKMKAPIGFDKVVILLHEVDAPKEILQKYLKLIDDTSRRMELAKKFNCPEGVIDALIQMKDREQLELYRSKLKPHSQAWFYADNALQASTIKWKK